jgi:predicted acylesterase/phospholipase RssA
MDTNTLLFTAAGAFAGYLFAKQQHEKELKKLRQRLAQESGGVTVTDIWDTVETGNWGDFAGDLLDFDFGL